MADPRAADGDYLADPSDLAQRTGMDASSPDLLLALDLASGRFREAVNHHVTMVEDDEHWATGDGGAAIRLPAAPIVGTIIVEIDGQPVEDYQVGRRSGLLRRPAGWPDGLENIRITYSHGYVKVPKGIQDAVLDAAEAGMNVRAGIESVSTGNESVKLSALYANGGVTDRWTAAVDKYTMGGGDRS